MAMLNTIISAENHHVFVNQSAHIIFFTMVEFSPTMTLGGEGMVASLAVLTLDIISDVGGVLVISCDFMNDPPVPVFVVVL